MQYRETVQIPPNLIDDAAYLAAEVSIYPEDATEGILLLEELGLATRCRMEGPVPPPPKTRMVVAHEIRDGQYVIRNGQSHYVEGVAHDLGQVWLNAHGLARTAHYGKYARVEISDSPVLGPAVWYELRLTKEARLSLRLRQYSNADEPSYADHIQVARWIGRGRIELDGETISLTEREGYVVQALVEEKSATSPILIERSGVEEAPKLLRKIISSHPKLARFIKCPGGKGQGGYSTTIRDATQ